MKLKKIFKGLCPPYLLEVIKRIYYLIKKSKEEPLFGGDEYLFKRLSKEAKIYGEYGCGQSTIWMAQNTDATIISADTSIDWCKKIETLTMNHGFKVIYDVADCGEIIGWGFPRDYSKRDNFKNYFESIWNKKDLRPDTVLIDGRFRLACFFTCLLKADVGTKIIFDDYVNRPYYHIIENYIKPVEYCGRQALFIIPNKENKKYQDKDIINEITNFKHVFN